MLSLFVALSVSLTPKISLFQVGFILIMHLAWDGYEVEATE